MKNLKTLDRLWETIQDRKKNPKQDSYTNELLNNPPRIVEKINEESQELIEAVQKNNIKGKNSVVWESADLIYHLLVLLASTDIEFDEIMTELERRMK